MAILAFAIFLSMYLTTIIFAQPFQMEWNKTTSTNETWITVNLHHFYDYPIIVATPEYTTTTNDNGISTWIRNITNTSFELRTTDENFASQDSITVHYIVMEKGSWTLPGSNIKVQAGDISTTKYGYQGSYTDCPTGGEKVSFSPTFDSNPLVISTRVTDTNPSVFAATIQSAPSSSAAVTNSAMCIRLSRSRAGTATFSNPETIHWIALDEGNGTIGSQEYEALWNLQDTGDSSGNWINGYDDGIPFTQSWSHTWSGSPNVIIGSQTSIAGGDGSWPVIYDTGNTASIRMFVDESNERAHGGSESGGGWAFNSAGYVEASPQINWTENTLDLGYGTVNETNISKTISIESYKTNDNVVINCESGDLGFSKKLRDTYTEFFKKKKENEDETFLELLTEKYGEDAIELTKKEIIQAAREFCEKQQPLLCIGGHIHEGFGIDKINNTTLINAGFGSYVNTLVEIKNNQIINIEQIDKTPKLHMRVKV